MWHTFGRCYTIELPTETSEWSVLALSIESQPGLRLYIYPHAPGQFHEMDSLEFVVTTLGYRNYVSLTYSVDVDSLGKESHVPCDNEVNHSFDECLHVKTESKLMEKFGCSVPFILLNQSVPICQGLNKVMKSKTCIASTIEQHNMFVLIHAEHERRDLSGIQDNDWQ